MIAFILFNQQEEFMSYTTYEIEDAKLAFEKTKKITKVLTLPVQALFLVFFGIRIFFLEQFENFLATNNFIDLPMDILFFIIAASMLITGIIATIIWKCPNCGKRFGRAKVVKHCMHCGIELE